MSSWPNELLFITAISLASSLALASEPPHVVVKLSDGNNGHMANAESDDHSSRPR
ncbi:hypothetical protein [Trinickia soli]|jgi:hypothetical protein|uniref:hypothetical protein n=1 Tax=Trinickia soli TaxID=380675 RepID=UPI001359C146